jgi:hypothetical protein
VLGGDGWQQIEQVNAKRKKVNKSDGTDLPQ